MRMFLFLLLITVTLFLIHSKKGIIHLILVIVKLLFVTVTFFVFVRLFIINVYVVPTGSMRNTIDMGDYILTLKINRFDKTDKICVFKSMNEYSDIKYVKRCVAGPGDTVHLKNNDVYVNGKIRKEVKTCRWFFDYEKQNINIDSIECKLNRRVKIKKSKSGIKQILLEYGEAKALCFDLSTRVSENIENRRKDNMESVYIPRKGDEIVITKENAKALSRLIEYEDEHVSYSDSCIYKDEKILKEYKFEHDYYFMMGDERDFSYDSRFYGPVADDKFIGSVVKIINKSK